MKHLGLVTALALAMPVTTAHAGFFFEGLQAHAIRDCDDMDPTLTDPDIAAPAPSPEESPGAHSVDKPPFAAAPCHAPGKYDGQPMHGGMPPRAGVQAHGPDAVPHADGKVGNHKVPQK